MRLWLHHRSLLRSDGTEELGPHLSASFGLQEAFLETWIHEVTCYEDGSPWILYDNSFMVITRRWPSSQGGFLFGLQSKEERAPSLVQFTN